MQEQYRTLAREGVRRRVKDALQKLLGCPRDGQDHPAVPVEQLHGPLDAVLGREIHGRFLVEGDEWFGGHVSTINPQGEYTPRNVQTEAQRAEQVFGVKVLVDRPSGRAQTF